jgi:hypothetical protein
MFEEGHQLGGLSFEGNRIKKVDLPMGYSEKGVDLSTLEEKEDLSGRRGFREDSIGDTGDEV